MNTAYAIVKERIYLFTPAACIQMQVTLEKAVPADALCKAIRHAPAIRTPNKTTVSGDG